MFPLHHRASEVCVDPLLHRIQSITVRCVPNSFYQADLQVIVLRATTGTAPSRTWLGNPLLNPTVTPYSIPGSRILDPVPHPFWRNPYCQEAQLPELLTHKVCHAPPERFELPLNR
jgi:hypothetical protein